MAKTPVTPTITALWEHQNGALDHLIRVGGPAQQLRWGAVVMPTGSGKSAVLKMATALLLEQPQFKGAVLVTPYRHVEDALQADEAFAYAPADEDPIVRHLPPEFWERPRDTDGAFADQLCDLLVSNAGRALLTTHAQVTHPIDGTRAIDLLPADLTGFVLLVDEVHHSGTGIDRWGEETTCIFDLAEAWHARGGLVLTATASTTRHDGRRIYPAFVEPWVVSFSELAAKGLFPKHLVFRVLEIVVDPRPTGVLLDSDITSICAYMRQEGRPAIVKIPSGDSVLVADQFVAELQAIGIPSERVLNAVGPGSAVASRVCKALLRDRAASQKNYAKRALDVVVSCQRFNESADWPICSHGISVGAPVSLPAVLQFAGRTLRSKGSIPGYPAAWVDDSLYTVFVPKLDNDEAERRKQAQRLLLIACALECSDAEIDFQGFWAGLVKNFRLPPLPGRQAVHLAQVDPDIATDAKAMLVQAAAILRDSGLTPTIARVKHVFGSLGLEHLAVIRELLLNASDGSPELQDAFLQGMRAILVKAAERLLAGDEKGARRIYRDLLYDHLVALADQYGHLVVDIDVKVARGFQGTLTPAEMRSITKSLVQIRNRVHTMNDTDIATRIVNPYKAKYGQVPCLLTGAQDVSEFVGHRLLLRQVNAHLRRTQWNLDCLTVAYTRKWITRPPVDLALVLDHVRRTPSDHIKLPVIPEGKLRDPTWLLGVQFDPRYSAERLLGGLDESVVGLELACRRGWRGLPGGSTLQQTLSAAEAALTPDQ